MLGIWALGIWGLQPAAGDVVHTLDGKTYDGEIRLEGGTSLHIVDKDGRNSAVKLSHLLDASFDGVATLSRGVVLVDGTVLAGSIDSIGDKFVRVTPPGQPTAQFPIDHVARVMFQPASAEIIGKIPTGSSGLLLKGGDFLDGQLRNYDGRSVRMESALFGLADFDAQTKAIALILRPARKLDAETIVRTITGSELAAEQLNFDHGQLRFTAIGIGPMAMSRKDLAGIQTGGGRLVALADLQPESTSHGASTGYGESSGTSSGLSPRLLGVDVKHALTVSAGSAITYDLDGKYDVFTVRAGIPADAVPMGQLRFAILTDGKEAARAVQCSVDDPAAFNVDIRHAQKLTLVVTAPSPTESGMTGIWADPQLVRHAVQKFTASSQP